MSTCMSIIAYTILVGLYVRGSRSAMFCILMSSAFIAFWTLLEFTASSICGMCVDFCGRCIVCAATCFSYLVMAASILASIFFRIISSLTPSLPCSANSDRAGMVVFAVLALNIFSARRIARSSLVRATIFSSAASRRAVSYLSMEWSGVGCVGGCFYFYLA